MIELRSKRIKPGSKKSWIKPIFKTPLLSKSVRKYRVTQKITLKTPMISIELRIFFVYNYWGPGQLDNDNLNPYMALKES